MTKPTVNSVVLAQPASVLNDELPGLIDPGLRRTVSLDSVGISASRENIVVSYDPHSPTNKMIKDKIMDYQQRLLPNS